MFNAKGDYAIVPFAIGVFLLQLSKCFNLNYAKNKLQIAVIISIVRSVWSSDIK